MKQKRKPITLLTGYLGSGKTTLMNYILSNQHGFKTAVVVNDMGAVNIDAKLINQNRYVEKESELVQLQNGCICCTLRDDFVEEIERLSRLNDIEYILVEASGISSPSNIAEGLLEAQSEREIGAYIDTIVAVVDANRIYSEFIDALEQYDGGPDNDKDIINLVVEQIEFSNVILLNKCDLLEKDQIRQVKDVVRMLQPEAQVIETVNSVVPLENILDRGLYDYDQLSSASNIAKALDGEQESEMEEYGIRSFVYERKEPFNEKKFNDFINHHYPKQFIRAKGYIWFAENPDHAVLFEQSGNSIAITEMSNWIAACSLEEQKQVFDEYPDVLDDWDQVYGDRSIQVVFIGKDYDEEAIRKELDGCVEMDFKLEQE